MSRDNEFAIKKLHRHFKLIFERPRINTIKLFFKWVKPGPLFVYFHSFHMTNSNTINEKSIDGVLGTRTQGGMMVGADKSTELWRHPNKNIFAVIELP